MAADDNFDPHQPVDEPKQLTRRALLKELRKAPGVMGALLIPTTWVTPLMEFTRGVTTAVCSGTPGVNACSGNALSLPFPSGDKSSVTFAAAWYGLIAGTAITATLDRPNRKVRVTLTPTFTFGQAPASGNGTLDTVNGVSGFNWSFTDASPTKATMALKTAFAGGVLCTNTSGPDNFSMDMQVTGTQAAYSLSVNNFRSGNC